MSSPDDNDKTFEVRRNPWRGWGWALVGIPFLVMGVDVLFTRYFTDQLLEIAYSTAANTEGTMETRDYIFAAIFILAGGGLVLYGLKELLAPTLVMLADDLGLEVRSGPFATPLRYRWENVGAIEPRTVDIDGASHEVLHIGEVEPTGPEPWGGRWAQPDGLDILTEGWSMSSEEVTENLEERRLSGMEVAVVDNTDGETAIEDE
ncbi:MAG: hypothetical protein GEU79_05180 [Acidimicrobiia bacterium]|nr:hypothetical protein [Acidimicrobiia bacterium]